MKEVVSDNLIKSAILMERATNYHLWCYDEFKHLIRGDVLEVGCGIGCYTPLIAAHEWCESLLSIDLSAEAVDYAQRVNVSPKVAFRAIDLMNIDGAFDSIICMNVMEHVNDDSAFLAKLFSVLKPGGVLFLLVPSHQWLYSKYDVTTGHFRRYTKASMSRFALPPNIEQIAQYYFNWVGALGWFFVFKLLKRNPSKNLEGDIGFFNRLIPFIKCFSPRWMPLGLSVITVFQKIK